MKTKFGYCAGEDLSEDTCEVVKEAEFEDDVPCVVVRLPDARGETRDAVREFVEELWAQKQERLK